MSKIWAIAWKDLRNRARDVPALAMMLVAPLALAGLLGFAFDDKVHRNKVTIQIERLGADPIQAGAENPLPGQDWTWCMPDNPGTYE